MNIKDIQAYVYSKSNFAIEIYHTLISSKKESTISFLKQTSSALITRSFINTPDFLQHSLIRDKEQRQQKITEVALERFSIEELMLIQEVESRKNQNTLMVIFPVFRNAAIKTMAYFTGLDGNMIIKMRETNYDAYMELGEILILAGIYIIVAERAIVK
jgi:hypothetical protein